MTPSNEAVLRAADNRTSQEIAALLQVSIQEARRVLNRLAAKGEVVFKDGKWSRV